MGVRRLQSFLEQSCRSSIPIQSIHNLAESRRNSPGEELVIVVDGSNCIRHIYADLAWVGGAQLKEYGAKAEEFVNEFRAIGIRLVFFFDGPTVQKKRRTWVERRMNTMNKVNHVLDKISNGSPSNSINKNDYFMLPPGMGQQTRLIFEIICRCEVYQSVMECDEEIAEYARSHDVFGVLGHDSDYVIFDIGRALYLDAEHLDLHLMRTRVYYPQVLASSIGLHRSRLPLLATLMGNDVVKYDDLVRFHARLMNGPNRNVNQLIPRIVSYINTLPDDILLHEVHMQVAQDALQNGNRARDIKTSIVGYRKLELPDEEDDRNREMGESRLERNERARGVRGEGEWRGRIRGGREWRGRGRGGSFSQGIGRGNQSRWNDNRNSRRRGSRGEVGSRGFHRRETGRWGMRGRDRWQEDYRGQSREDEEREWLRLVREVRRLHRNNKLPGMIYAVIKGLPFESSTSIEDYRINPPDLPIFAELTLVLRQRLYGILLQQKPRSGGSHEVEEWCMSGPGSLDRPHYNPAVPPYDSHPGLLALWGDDDRPDGPLSDARWDLFVHSISPLLSVNTIRLLPPHLVVPVLILHHIMFYEGPGHLEDWEAEAALATACVLRHYSARRLAAIAPDPMTSRSIRVANLIMRTSFVFYNLQAACGNPLSTIETAPWLFFDGKLFQQKYREAQNPGTSRAQLCDNRVDSLEAFHHSWNAIFNE